MTQKLPVASFLNKKAYFTQLFIIVAATVCFTWGREPLGIIAVFFYLFAALIFLRFCLESLCPGTRLLRKGVKLLRGGNAALALPLFSQAAQYFTQRPWLDKYRHILLLSISSLTFREAALINIAVCHSQLGEIAKSRDLYKEILKEYPNNILAQTSVKFFENLDKENAKAQQNP